MGRPKNINNINPKRFHELEPRRRSRTVDFGSTNRQRGLVIINGNFRHVKKWNIFAGYPINDFWDFKLAAYCVSKQLAKFV